MNRDFPITRRIIIQLDAWIAVLAVPYLPLIQVREDSEAFHWGFREHRPEILIIGKAVRMASGIKASLVLADLGFTTECAGLLRMVSDFSQEILSVGEGLIEGRLTQAQQRFVRQYFSSLARTPEEFEENEKERYVSREELYKAHYRLLAKTSNEANNMRRLSRFLNYAYDRYVHGAYLTAMELYNGYENRFMLNGHEVEEQKIISRTSVAGKLHEVISALEMMALFSESPDLRNELREARQALDASQEY